MEKTFTEVAKSEYDGLVKQETELKTKLDEVRKQLKPLRGYLVQAGIIEARKRKPRTPAGQ